MSLARRLLPPVLTLLAVGALSVPLLQRRQPAAAQPEGLETATPVQVVKAERHLVQKNIRLSGVLQSGATARVAPRIGGKVLEVFVRVGDAVRAGQPLARLDVREARHRADEAGAALTAAQAQVAEANAGARLQKDETDHAVRQAQTAVDLARQQLARVEAGIRLQRQGATADVERAEAGLSAARAGAARVRKPVRPEERVQAETQVRQAERAEARARQVLEDLEYLHAKGGVAKVEVDEARESQKRAADAVTQARAQLSLLVQGATAEDIAAAEAEVQRAEAAVKAARAAANRTELDTAELEAARTQVRQAEAGVRAAEASRRRSEVSAASIRRANAAVQQATATGQVAKEVVEEGLLRAPQDGIIATCALHVGELAAPGVPLVTVVSRTGLYLEAFAPARWIGQLRPGQTARIFAPGAADPWAGTVTRVDQAAGPDGRSYRVEIALGQGGNATARPGAFVRAEVVIEQRPDAVTVPPTVVRGSGDETFLWVVRNGKAVKVPVLPGIQDTQRVAITGDVQPGDAVIETVPPGLNEGDAVQVQAWD